MTEELENELEEYGEEYREKVRKQIEEEEPDINRDILNNLFQDEEEFEEADRGLDILFNEEDKRKISDIEANTVKDITVLLTFSRYINTPLIEAFCDNLLTLSLSKDRKSRMEIVEIYKTTILGENLGGGFGGFYNQYDVEPRSFFGKMKDRFRGG